MTKKHFIAAAALVNSIRLGEWTPELPEGWVGAHLTTIPAMFHADDWALVRAVQTAEAFILLFRQFNPLFDESRFLVACGLQKPATK